MLKSSPPVRLTLLALISLTLSACTYENWDNSPPRNEVPGGWDDIHFHKHDLGSTSPIPSPLAGSSSTLLPA